MTTPLPPCIDCQRPMRRRSEPTDGRPIHQGRGRCQTCYERARLRQRKSRATMTDQEREERRAANIAAATRARRKRLAALASPEPIAEDWKDRAECPTVGPYIFEDAELWPAAKALCSRCPVARSCLEAALDEEAGTPASYRAGVRGGLTPADRRSLDRLRRRQEPAA